MRKASVVVLAICVVLSMSVTAFAATYTTTTTYVLGTPDKVSVTTAITATGSEQVTYIAYTGAPTDTPTDSTILYVNQDAASNGIISFTYEVPPSAMNTSTIKVGTVAGLATTGGANNGVIKGYKITPSIIGGTVTGIENAVVIESNYYTGTTNTVVVSVAGNTGHTILGTETVVVQGGTAATTLPLSGEIEISNITGDVTVSVTIAEDEDDPEPEVISSGDVPSTLTGSNNSDNAITTVGAVTGVDISLPSVEFGILFSPTLGTLGTVGSQSNLSASGPTLSPDLFKYVALGAYGTGTDPKRYAVKLIDGGSNRLSGTAYYTCTYLKVGSVWYYGEVVLNN